MVNKNFTVAPGGCHFKVYNKLGLPKDKDKDNDTPNNDDETNEEAGDEGALNDNFGQFNFMFNDDIKVLVSNNTADFGEDGSTSIEMFQEVTPS